MFLSRYTAIAFVVFAVLFPVRTPCEGSFSVCSSVPDYRGQVQQYHDIQPFSVMLLERFTGQSIPIMYRRTASLF